MSNCVLINALGHGQQPVDNADYCTLCANYCTFSPIQGLCHGLYKDSLLCLFNVHVALYIRVRVCMHVCVYVGWRAKNSVLFLVGLRFICRLCFVVFGVVV